MILMMMILLVHGFSYWLICSYIFDVSSRPTKYIGFLKIFNLFQKERSVSSDASLCYDIEKQLTRCLLSPLSSIPNAIVEAYLGNLDFFFIRETTDLREVSNLEWSIVLLNYDVINSTII